VCVLLADYFSALLRLLESKQCLKLADLLLTECLRELDFEVNEQVALHCLVREEWQSHLHESLHAAGRHDHALWLAHQVLAAVELGELAFEPTDRFLEIDLQGHGQVSLLTLEHLVLLLLDSDNNITCFTVWLFVSHV